MMNINNLRAKVGKLAAILNEHKLGLVVIIGLAILVNRNFLFTSALPAGIDALGWVRDISLLAEDNSMFYPIGYEFGMRLPLSILNLAIQDSVLTVKFFAFATFLLSGIAMYFFSYYYTRQKAASFFSSVLFMASQWYISHFANSGLALVFAYAIMPLVFLLFDKSLKEGTFKWTALFSGLFMILLLMKVRPAVFAGLFLFLYLIFIVLIPYDGLKRKEIITRIFKVVSVEAVLVLLFSAFLLSSYFLLMWPGYVGPQTSVPLVSILYDLNKSLSGFARELSYMGWVWGIRWEGHPFLSKPFYFLVMALPAILAFSAILIRKNRLILFLTASALISAFIAKGPNPPLGEVFSWFYNKLPFAGIFHVPNRWLIITCFCYAFLSGITVNWIYVKVKDSLNILSIRSKVFKAAEKVLPSIAVIIFTFPLLLPAWPAFSEGFLTYQLPEKEIKPHLWVAKQEGDFAVATVPNYQNYMWVDWEEKGWVTHDIGADSSFFSRKRVVTAATLNPLAADFIGYIHGLTVTNKTDDIMKILGLSNVRYLVMQGYPAWEPKALPKGYAPYYQHSFFEKQQGLKQVYTYEDTTVYENEFWTPRIFCASNYAIVVGGKETLNQLTEFDEFDLSKWNLLFADQIIRQSVNDNLERLFSDAQAIIFINSTPFDLAMLTLEDAIRVKAVDYAHSSTDQTKYWVSDDWATKMGMFVLNNRTLSTSGSNQVSIPIDVTNDGKYQVWARVLRGPKRGELTLALDGRVIGTTIPWTLDYTGLKWIEIGSVELERGKHQLELQNALYNTGARNDVDEIVLVQPGALKFALDETLIKLQNSDGRTVYFLTPQQMSGQTPWHFDSGDLREDIIYNDDQTAFWYNSNPDHVDLLNDAEVKIDENSRNSLKISIKSGRGIFTLIKAGYNPMVDWSNSDDLSLWFKGNKSERVFSFNIFFAGSYDNYANFYIPDTSSEWRQFSFRQANPDRFGGTIDWSKVWRITFACETKDVSGSFYLDRMTRITRLEEKLRVSALKDSKYPIILGAEKGPDFGTLGVQLRDQPYLVCFDEFKEIDSTVVANDNQASFWGNITPDHVDLHDDTLSRIDVGSENSLKISLHSRGRPTYSFIRHNYIPMEDWSKDQYLVLWFKGENTGANFGLTVCFDGSYSNKAIFWFQDASTDWKRLVFSKSQPDGTDGNVDWSKVWAIVISSEKDLTGEYHIDHLSRCEDIETERIALEPAVYFQAGEHVIDLYPRGKVGIDHYVLYSLYEHEEILSLGDLFNPGSEKAEVLSYEKINPAKYVVHINSLKPFWLVFSDPYHPLWKANIDGEEIEPVPSYSFANGFYLNKSGEYDVTIEFTGQRYIRHGFIISIVSILVAIAFAILGEKARGFFPKKRIGDRK